TFGVLYVFFVLSLERRRVLHVNVTAHPYAAWAAAQQMIEAVAPDVVGERHLLRLVRDYARFYNDDRPHMALDGDAPARRAVEGPRLGDVVALPRVGGLHHRYSRAA